ncbi:transglycosylase [Terrabacter koreensis]
MLSTIIGAIIVGAIIGALGRLILPGKQNISIVVTILIGIVANVIVTLVVRQIGYANNGGIAWIPLILGAIVAAILIIVYGRMTSKSV